MKKLIIFALLVISEIQVFAQSNDQRIIIDVTSTDNKVYQSTLLMVNLMSQSYPETKFDVIAYGEAVPIFMKDRTPVASDIKKHISNENISFTACEVSMSLFNIKEDQLIDGVIVVENAVNEIVRKQGEGWGYIKSGN